MNDQQRRFTAWMVERMRASLAKPDLAPHMRDLYKRRVAVLTQELESRS